MYFFCLGLIASFLIFLAFFSFYPKIIKTLLSCHIALGFNNIRSILSHLITLTLQLQHWKVMIIFFRAIYKTSRSSCWFIIPQTRCWSIRRRHYLNHLILFPTIHASFNTILISLHYLLIWRIQMIFFLIWKQMRA